MTDESDDLQTKAEQTTCPHCRVSYSVEARPEHDRVQCIECGWRSVSTTQEIDDVSEKPTLQVVGELKGKLTDHIIERSPPISEEDEGIIEGLEMGVQELEEIMDEIQEEDDE